MAQISSQVGQWEPLVLGRIHSSPWPALVLTPSSHHRRLVVSSRLYELCRRQLMGTAATICHRPNSSLLATQLESESVFGRLRTRRGGRAARPISLQIS